MITLSRTKVLAMRSSILAIFWSTLTQPAPNASTVHRYLAIAEMGRFVVENPNPVWQNETADKVASLIVTKVNPAVAIHSGRVSLVDFNEDIAYIVMQGGCQGCGLATVTLRQGIERLILDEVPAIKSVVDVTAHDEGETPFFRRGQVGESPLT